MGLTTACMMYSDVKDIAIFSSVCTVASIFPDIDVKNSEINQKLNITGTIAHTLLKHRSITHTPIFGALTTYGIWILCNNTRFLPMYTVNAWVLGYLIHLIQDTLTKRGIKWFFPIINIPISLCRMPSDSIFGYLISAGLYVLGLVIIKTAGII